MGDGSFIETDSGTRSFNTDFGESVEYSSLGSHKSMKDYDIDTIMRLSNDAVLFAMLCQQYVQFKKQGV